MKKLFFAVSALAALTLLAPNAGFAGTAFNQLGLYTDEVGTESAASIDIAPSTQFNVFLVVNRPVNEAFVDGNGTPPFQRVMNEVSGYECAVGFWDSNDALIPGLFVLATTFNGNAVRLGTGGNFVVGFASPIPVTAGAAMLTTFNIMVLDTNPKEIFLDVSTPASLPGTMAIVDGAIVNDNLQAAFPSSGNLSAHVFGINTGVVAVENESWGGVKALFR